MDMTKWIEKASKLLYELHNIDFGYPLGDNIIKPPKDAAIVSARLSFAGYWDNKQLYNFYIQCDGLSWPDVHNGYFIHSIERLDTVEHAKNQIPVRVSGEYGGPITVFGSDGGGGLIAIRREHNDVLYLPTGPVQDGAFDGAAVKIKRIGHDLSDFLEKLLADLEAFVIDKEEHIYLI